MKDEHTDPYQQWLIKNAVDEFLAKDRDLSRQIEVTHQWRGLMNASGKHQADEEIPRIAAKRQQLSDEFDRQMMHLRSGQGTSKSKGE